MSARQLRERVTRRGFLVGTSSFAAATVLAACRPQPKVSPTAPSAPSPATAPSSATVAAPTKVSSVSTPVAKSASTGATPMSSPSASAGPTYSPAKLDGKTINIWILDFAPFKEYWGKIGQRFEQLTAAKINFQPQAWPLEVKLVAAMAAGTVPDVVNLMGKDTATVIPPKRDLLEPTDDAVFKTLGIDPSTYFTPDAIGCWLSDGKHWGVPLQDNVVSLCYYTRPDYLKASNAEDLWPRTQGKDIFDSFDHVYELAKKLQQGSNGRVTRWGTNSAGWMRTNLFSAMKSLGVDWWEPGNKKFNMDSDAAVQAIEAIIATPVRLGIEAELNQTAENAFDQGKVALARSTISTQSAAQENHFSVTDVAAPPLNGGKVAFVGEGGWGAVVPRQAKNKEAALELMKFLVTPEGERLWIPIFGGTPPAIKALRDDPIFQGSGAQNTRTYLHYQPLTTYMGNGYGNEEVMSPMIDSVGDEVRQKKLTAKQAAQQIQKNLMDEYKKFYNES